MWLVYALATVALWGAWGTLGKQILKDINWIQASIFYGIAIVVLTVVLLAIRNRESNWSTGDLWLPSLTGLIGALGLLMF